MSEPTSESNLFPQVCAMFNLRLAFEHVEESDGCAGIDGVTLAQFADDLETELGRLSLELIEGSYEPLPAVRFFGKKRDGGQRVLCVFAVRDRVAQRAVTNIIGPRLEAEFEDVSFAYRRRRSVKQALAEVERWRDQGYQWVVDADISAFFDSVDHALLLERVRNLIADERVLDLIGRWIAPVIYDGQKMSRMEKGLPQGAPISPMLANLFLDKFDEQMIEAGFKLVRFADDFLLLCKTKPKAEDGLELTRETLDALCLAINEEKTRVTDFNTGFTFLGATFVRSLCLIPPPGSRDDDDAPQNVTMPPALTMPQIKAAMQSLTTSPSDIELKLPGDSVEAASVESAPGQPPIPESAIRNPQSTIEMPPPRLFTLRTLYLQEHGAVLRCEDEHLIVSKDEVELISLPAFKLDQIILLGNSHLTTPAMKFCLRNNIPVILLSGRGEFFGAIESTGNENVVLQQQQFARLADERFVLETARRIVAGKIANCRALLQRRGRTGAAAADERIVRAVAAIEEIKNKLAAAGTIDEVRGYEGAAAARYYEALGACFPPPFEFKGRTRRPPLDPVNALLSFGYTLLFYNIYAIARGRGLSPYVGTLHSIRQGHPALCSDLIEEFRAPVVDALVTSLLNKRIIGQGDFHFAETSSGARGCFLTDQARRTFITQFEQRINTLVRHPLAGINTTWRGCIDIQVGHYVQLLRGATPAYLPIEMR